MVFDTLKQSLSDFTQKVTSPVDTITEVTRSMKKKVLGPDTNLLALIENTLRYTPYQEGIKKQFTKLIASVKKLKIAATKKTKILASFALLQSEIEKEKDFALAANDVPELLKKFEKIIKKGSLPIAYEKNDFIVDTVTLSAGDTNTIITLFQEMQIEITNVITAAKKPFAQQYMTPLQATYDYKKEKNTFHDAWKKAIDTLIDDEYEVTKLQKELLYTTTELSRQQRLLEQAQSDKRTGKDDKDTVRRINHAKQRIEVLINKDIVAGLKTIDAGLKKIIADEQAILDLWKTYTTTYTTWSKQLTDRLSTNRTQTKKVVVLQIKKRDAAGKALATHLKKLQTLYKKIATSIEKDTSFSALETTKTLLTQDVSATDAYTQEVITWLSMYAEQMQYHAKDLEIYRTLIQDHMTYTYGTQVLEKERVIQLKLLLSIKTRHAEISNEIRHNLLDVENKVDVDLKKAITHTQQHAENCKKQRKAYETEIGTRSKELKKYSTAIKELRGADRAWSYTSSWLESMYIAQVNSAYAQSLESLKSSGKEHITSLKALIKKITINLGEQKKTLATLEKKEQPTAANKKEIKTIADMMHQGELYIDVLNHHLSTEEEHQDDQQQLAKNYSKIAATQTNKKMFYEKQASASIAKTKKYLYLKDTLTSPEKMTGKSI